MTIVLAVRVDADRERGSAPAAQSIVHAECALSAPGSASSASMRRLSATDALQLRGAGVSLTCLKSLERVRRMLPGAVADDCRS
ncbi:MAG: hypothetical protein H6835_19710 [Planctomycetes bacterium]|nr:hypothetical protein [Planctomycetota bacterium]